MRSVPSMSMLSCMSSDHKVVLPGLRGGGDHQRIERREPMPLRQGAGHSGLARIGVVAVELPIRREFPASGADTVHRALPAFVSVEIERPAPGCSCLDCPAPLERPDNNGAQADRQAVAPFRYAHRTA